MSNLKGKVSLFLVIIMMMTSILPIFTVSAAENVVDRIMVLTASKDGKNIPDDTTIVVNPEDTNRKINVSVEASSTENLEIGYAWDYVYPPKIAAKGTKTATITIPNFKAGTVHILQIEAIINDKNGDVYGQSNILDIAVEIPDEKVEATTVEVNVKNGSKSLSTSGKNELEVGTKLTVVGTSNKTVEEMGYIWDNEAIKELKGSSATITVPEFKEGTTHTLTVQAIANDGTVSEVKKYTITIPVKVVEEATTVEVNVKNGSKSLSTSGKNELEVGTKLTLVGTSNKTVVEMGYIWDDGAIKELKGSSATITVPEFKAGSTHTLTVQAIANDDTLSEVKKYTIVIPAAVVNPPAEEIDDELITEEWMKESSELDALSVSLRNGSDEDKQNKNIYVLGEEVIYYIDYANGTSKDIDNAKIVFETELAFDVVDAFGGKVDGKKVTWEFPNGIEEGQTGTKVLVLKYNSLGKSSIKSKVINPVADIYKGTKVADSSAVINLIFKDEETEITNDEHYPYMKGDADKPTFRPDDGITRAEGALVLTRIFGMSTSGTTVSNEYSDLGETYLEAQKAIVAASKAGLINGYEDGTYKPNKKMTRAEFMKIIAANIELVAEEDDVRGLEIKTSDEEIKIYKDPTKSYVVGNATVNEHWASSYVTFLARLNMTSASKKEKDLRLDEPITRAEVAQLVNFYLLRAPAEDVKTTQFTDVSKNHKLFGDIVEATRDAHTYFLTVEGTEIVED